MKSANLVLVMFLGCAVIIGVMGGGGGGDMTTAPMDGEGDGTEEEGEMKPCGPDGGGSCKECKLCKKRNRCKKGTQETCEDPQCCCFITKLNRDMKKNCRVKTRNRKGAKKTGNKKKVKKGKNLRKKTMIWMPTSHS